MPFYLMQHLIFRCGCRGGNGGLSGAPIAPAHHSPDEDLIDQLQHLQHETKKAKDNCAELAKQVRNKQATCHLANRFLLTFQYYLQLSVY